MVLFNILMIYR